VLLASGKTVQISAPRMGEGVLAVDTKTGKNRAETVWCSSGPGVV
jgi:hypothetical protein